MVLSRLAIVKNYATLFLNSLKWVTVKKGGGFLNSGALNTKYLLDLFYNKDYIFIHINKTGGSSIEKALNDKEQVHLTAYTIINYIGSKEFNSKFKFAFVRNPYDRVVSQYHYRLQGDQTGIRSKNISFSEWVKKTYVDRNDDYYNFPAMFQNQLDWISDPDGNLLVDFVGRFENFEEDFKTICKKLNLQNTKLPHSRKSKREKGYMDYYDKETLTIISEKFDKDFQYFNYNKIT